MRPKNKPLSDQAYQLFRSISHASTSEYHQVRENLSRLTNEASLSWSLKALFRQQINIGYVLFDPANPEQGTIKTIPDPHLKMNFQVQWNPDRELRRNRDVLIQRGIISGEADPQRLDHLDHRGIPCYLCPSNIAVQNPKEIVLQLQLAGETYIAGANFACIGDNHFTIMSGKHRPQRYHLGVIEAALDLVDLTHGEFRVIFNGLAGASIEAHEHLQATTTPLPVETLPLNAAQVTVRSIAVTVLRPSYYLPLWLVEGADRKAVSDAADKIIQAWQNEAPPYHTENLLITRTGERYRVFIFLRDRRRLTATGRRDALATCEAAGLIVLSYRPANDRAPGPDELELFHSFSIQHIRRLFSDVQPFTDLESLVR